MIEINEWRRCTYDEQIGLGVVADKAITVQLEKVARILRTAIYCWRTIKVHYLMRDWDAKSFVDFNKNLAPPDNTVWCKQRRSVLGTQEIKVTVTDSQSHSNYGITGDNNKLEPAKGCGS